MILAQRLELLCGFRRNYVVMPMKIKRAFPSPMAYGKRRGMFIGVTVIWEWHEALAFQAQLGGPALKQLSKLTILSSRRIFRRHGNKFGQQRGHLLFTLPQPPN